MHALTGATPAARWAACRGVIHIRVQLGILAALAIRRVSIDDVYVTFADVTPDTNPRGSNSANYLFAANSDGRSMNPADVASISSPIQAVIPFVLGGRSWEARFAASDRFVAARVSMTPYIVLAVFALMFLLAIAGWCGPGHTCSCKHTLPAVRVHCSRKYTSPSKRSSSLTVPLLCVHSVHVCRLSLRSVLGHAHVEIATGKEQRGCQDKHTDCTGGSKCLRAHLTLRYAWFVLSLGCLCSAFICTSASESCLRVTVSVSLYLHQCVSVPVSVSLCLRR
jgi:hypothetical protein